ncbi:MAG TPA: hypothetical protein VNQ77_01760 [Frankiaceae bacterium]|nr:hypothetical protein [Frankiaceae bacterium]
MSRLLAEATQRPPATVQRVVYGSMAAMWQGVAPHYDPGLIARIIGADAALAALYRDAEQQLPVSDFHVDAALADPMAAPPLPQQPGLYRVGYPDAAPADPHFFVASILHELGHVAMPATYRTHRAAEEMDYPELWAANMHLPMPALGSGGESAQAASYRRQKAVIERNWADLRTLFEGEEDQFTAPQLAHVTRRLDYAEASAHQHNETVLGDLMYWLAANGHAATRTYRFAARMLREANDRRARPGTEARVVDRDAWWFQFWKW